MKKNYFIWIGLGAAILVGGFLAPFASSFPDGLERVAEDLGFIQWAQDNVLRAPIPDYAVQGIRHEGVATGAAGIIGVLITFSIVYIVGKIIVKKDKMKEA